MKNTSKVLLGIIGAISSILIGSFLYSTPANAQLLCNASPEQFATTGLITCGNIRWRLHPTDAARLAGTTYTTGGPVQMQIAKDMRPYLQKYQLAYEIIKDLTGYERPERELIIEERCAPSASGNCPNGRLVQDLPMYAIGNAIYIRNDFFETTFPFIATDSRQPLSTDLLRQMGRVFTPPQGGTADGYIWDSALPDSASEIQGVFGVLLYSQVNNLMEKFYSDEWCSKQGRARLCTDFFTTIDQYASIKYDRALQDYVARKDNFDTLFAIPYSTPIIPYSNLSTPQRTDIFNAMIAQTAREAGEQKLLFSYYDGLRKTLRAYNVFPAVVVQPANWHQDPTVLPLDLKYQKANYFVYLLSSYSRMDLSQSFLKWNFPLMKDTKDIILTNVNEASNEPRIPLLGNRIVSRSFSTLTLASAPRNLTVTDPKQTSSLVLSWDNTVDVAFNSFNIYRTDSDRGISALIAQNIKGNNYVDTALRADRTYFYEVSAVNMYGFESSITARVGKQPSSATTPTTWEQVFYFYSYGPAKIDDTYVEINWGTTRLAASKVMYATQEGGPYTLLEDNDKKFGGQFKLYNLQPATKYYYKVNAIDSSGLILEQKGTFTTLPSKNILQLTPLQQQTLDTTGQVAQAIAEYISPVPKPQKVFVGETGTGNSIVITWSKPADKKLLTRIYRSTIQNWRGYALVELKNDVTLWYDNDVEPLTKYTYTIVHVAPDSGIESNDVPWTLSISASPSIGPKNIRVTNKGLSNLVQWNLHPHVRTAQTITIYRSLAKGQLGRQVATGLPLSQTSFLDIPPPQNEKWQYTVRFVTRLAVEGSNTNQYTPVFQHLAKK